MARILALLLGLVALAFAARFALEGSMFGNPEAAAIADGPARTGKPGEQHTRPRQELDNVREKTREIERQQQQQLDETMRRAREAESK